MASTAPYISGCHCRWMSRAIKEMLNIMWCAATIGIDVEASILIYSARVGAQKSTMSGRGL